MVGSQRRVAQQQYHKLVNKLAETEENLTETLNNEKGEIRKDITRLSEVTEKLQDQMAHDSPPKRKAASGRYFEFGRADAGSPR